MTTQSTTRQTPAFLAQTQTSSAVMVDNLLDVVATILDNAAESLSAFDNGKADGGLLLNSAKSKLDDAALFLRRHQGSAIVNSGVDLAQRHPRLFVTSAGALAALAAAALVVAGRPEQRKRPSGRFSSVKNETTSATDDQSVMQD